MTEDVLLVVSELSANAALHSLFATGMFIVRVKDLGGLVHVEVQDRGDRGVRMSRMLVRMGCRSWIGCLCAGGLRTCLVGGWCGRRSGLWLILTSPPLSAPRSW